MLIGEEIAGGCTVSISDGVTEGIFDMKMIGDGTAEGCAVGFSDRDGDGINV